MQLRTVPPRKDLLRVLVEDGAGERVDEVVQAGNTLLKIHFG